MSSARVLARGLAVLECFKFVVPFCEDGVNIALCLGDGVGSASDDHVLVCAANFVAREENGNTIFGLQSIAIAYECVACVNRDGFRDFDGHNECVM